MCRRSYKPKLQPSYIIQYAMATVTNFPLRSTERAVCELCGGIIATTNGLYTGLRFISFERLLDLHMAERQANVCLLPAARERKIAA
jgi:hypothetical protein